MFEAQHKPETLVPQLLTKERNLINGTDKKRCEFTLCLSKIVWLNLSMLLKTGLPQKKEKKHKYAMEEA